ncbi:hypothetical protein KSS87_020224 [Heliosperma pusillum]|nr:hypothetical protein KSS87_020224 [Heliosperma pusillum]
MAGLGEGVVDGGGGEETAAVSVNTSGGSDVYQVTGGKFASEVTGVNDGESGGDDGDYLLVREIELSTIEAHDDNLIEGTLLSGIIDSLLPKDVKELEAEDVGGSSDDGDEDENEDA